MIEDRYESAELQRDRDEKVKHAIKEGRKNSRQKTVLDANGAYIRVWENKSK